MSEAAKQLFKGLNAVKDGALFVARESKPEFARLGTQGSMELASALFSGHGFVPYGPGQYTPSNDQQHGHERGMER